MPDRRDDTSPVVRLGVSACRNDFLTGAWGPCVEWVQVSPEVESGLMAGLDLDGFVLKTARMRRAALAGDEDEACSPISDPLLPVEVEGRLCDPVIREHFIERVLAHRRLRRLVASRPRVGNLVSFHTAHKLQLLAHSPDAYRQMGRMVACARADTFAPQLLEYGRAFAAALATVATRGRHVNVLQHAAGYLRGKITAGARRDIALTIADYQQELVPLVVPIRLIVHYVRLHRITFLEGQSYFDPHPSELLLRPA